MNRNFSNNRYQGPQTRDTWNEQNANFQAPFRQNNQPNPPKRSGATYTKIRNGNFEGDIIVNAWRSTRYGLMTAKVTPYAGKDKKGLEIVNSESKSGKVKTYQKMLCEIQNKALGTSQIYHVLMNLDTQVIVIDQLGLCITPNGSGHTRSGKKVTGYFGKFTK